MSLNFSAYEIGRRAMNASQLGINVTGQNIANVNTSGYTRQTVQTSEARPASFSKTAVGSGVTIDGVKAFRDQFIESRLQTETGIAGKLSAKRDALSAVETALQGTESSGLQNSLNGFFGAFRDLETNPASVPLRSVAAQKGAALASSFQTTRTSLEDIRRGVDTSIRSTVDEVNSVTQRIADLNAQIRTAEGAGGNASALRDQRGELLNRVSELTGARSIENQDGTVTVTIGEGRAIVSGDKASVIEAQSTPPYGLATLTIDGQPAVFDEGALRGLQDATSEINAQIANLDGLAAEVVNRVNNLHAAGTDIDDNAGVAFFDTSVPVTAANIRINPAISANQRLVVASALTQPGQTGTTAGAIANLLSDPNSAVGSRTGSFNSIFNSMLAETGEKVSFAKNSLETQTAIISQVTAQRDSISGVSLDEEAINLLQYQKSFEAAARFLKVADEMTQTILSLAG